MLNNQSVVVNVNTEPNRPRKSILLAYILFLLLGIFGVHRFYLGRPLSAFFLLLLTLGGFALAFPFILVGLWMLIDLFLIPGMARRG